ncbi:hypothetical protein CMZ84_07290 [Lysobacteraceae bacterium NML93-0399]|nr:hypothetical protein CMZ84_07290 [Xanthomonadaceae bacterium NML93-0399]
MRTYVSCLAVLVLAAGSAPIWAADTGADARRAGLQEISDAELGAMRGRYIVGDNQVAWFGVTMVSNWMTAAGQTVQGALQLGFDLRGGTPQVSFAPSVTITGEAIGQTAGGSGMVDGSGLTNVGGLVQGVQVAGDGNRARNGLSLRLRDGEVPAAGAQGPMVAETTVGDAHARAALDAGGARILLQVAGQGAAEQWIDAQSIGQSIRLAGNGHAVGNQLQLDLVRQAAPASATVHQNLVQAIGMVRAGGI